MIQARRRNAGRTVDDIFATFAPGEGRGVTLGINFPPTIAAAFRRMGNRGRSVSDSITSCIDAEKLAELLLSEQRRMEKIDTN